MGQAVGVEQGAGESNIKRKQNIKKLTLHIFRKLENIVFYMIVYHHNTLVYDDRFGTPFLSARQAVSASVK